MAVVAVDEKHDWIITARLFLTAGVLIGLLWLFIDSNAFSHVRGGP